MVISPKFSVYTMFYCFFRLRLHLHRHLHRHAATCMIVGEQGIPTKNLSIYVHWKRTGKPWAYIYSVTEQKTGFSAKLHSGG